MINDFTNNSFEEQWQNAFDDAELPPPEAVWENIESTFDNIPTDAQRELPKHGSQSLWFYGGAVLVGIVGFWYFMNNNQAVVVTIKPIVMQQKSSPPLIVPTIQPTISTHAIKQYVVKNESVTINKKQDDLPVNEDISRELLPDSIGVLNPVLPKLIAPTIEQINIESFAPHVPYYEVQKPKKPKKSIWKDIKVSVGVGAY
jgi:hypothetical protein